MKNVIILGALALLLVFGGSYLTKSSASKGVLIDEKGIHWHVKLEVLVNGEIEEVPASIGLIGEHNPMHTHEVGGEIHLEYGTAVYEDDVRLGKFFALWRKDFEREGLEVSMTINGAENTEFENYILQDGDNVVVSYN